MFANHTAGGYFFGSISTTRCLSHAEQRRGIPVPRVSWCRARLFSPNADASTAGLIGAVEGTEIADQADQGGGGSIGCVRQRRPTERWRRSANPSMVAGLVHDRRALMCEGLEGSHETLCDLRWLDVVHIHCGTCNVTHSK
jgi:hypothetical protein